jgi:hypothetical protein
VDDPKKEVAYRSLSLLAVVGLGLAGVYAAVVVLGGLVAFYHGDPWLMPGWSALFPIAAAVLSLLGLMQVQRSEGTLAGDKAARWGLLLSLLVGLGYWAYVGASYYAIGREADKFGSEYLKLLAKGDPYAAYRLTLAAADRPPDDAGLRAQLERRFNNLGGQGLKTPLSTYAQSEPVRMIGLGGPETTFESLGVEKWDYINGAYQVHVLYRVVMPEISFVMELTLRSNEGKRSEGRQWQVVWNETGMRGDPGPEMTEAGKNLLSSAMGTRVQLMMEWLQPMGEGKLETAFLRTRPAAEREAARQRTAVPRTAMLLADGLRSRATFGAPPGAGLACVAADVDVDLARAASLPGLDEFLAGDLVRADKDVYWAPEDIREDTVRLVREQFRRPGERLGRLLTPDMGSRNLPLMQTEGDHLLVGHDVALQVPPTAPKYLVEARVVIECDKAEATAGMAKSWRVRSIDLVSGKTLPTGTPPPMPQQHHMRPGM